jgi:dolichol kinase
VGALRTEWIRKGWHMATGLVVTPFLLYTNLNYATIVALAATFFVLTIEMLSLVLGIRLPFWTHQLERVRRPYEHFSWASVGFLLTLIVLVWVCPLPVALAAAGMLAFGDGMSSLVGRAFGRHRIPWNPRKTWEGSAAGFVAGILGAYALVAWLGAESTMTYDAALLGGVFVVGAAAAMTAESWPRYEDNVTVPLSAGLAMWAVWWSLGLEPVMGVLPARWLGA